MNRNGDIMNAKSPMYVNLLCDRNNNIYYSYSDITSDSLFSQPVIELYGSEKKIPIAPAGNYNFLKTLYVFNFFISLISEYKSGQNKILLSICKDNYNVYDISDFGKYENPSVCVKDNIAYIAFEEHIKTDSIIILKEFNLDTKIISDRGRISLSDHSYMPKLCIESNRLVCIYTSFYEDRYRAVVTDFKDSYEIGFKDGNDENISVCILENRLAVYIENSRHLEAGDEFIDTIIPAFGHGWKVDFKSGLTFISDGKQEISNSFETKIGELNTSDGSARLINCDGILYGIYLHLSRGLWQIKIAVFDGNAWKDTITTDLFLYDRVKPCVAYNAGVLYVFGYNLEKKQPCICEYNTPSNGYRYNFKPFDIREFSPKSEVVQRDFIEFDGVRYYAFWGDLHMHSNTSPCSRHAMFHSEEVEHKYRNAKDIGGLDFALLTDHDSMSQLYWERNKMASDLANIKDGFVAFNGFEWTSSMRADGKNYGHYNVIYKDTGDLFRITDASTETPVGLRRALTSSDNALAIPHHPSDATHPLDWTCFSSDFSPCVEIFQVRGSYEYYKCPMDPFSFGRAVVEKKSVRDALNQGYRFSFTAGGEHEGVGISCVYAQDFTRQSIFQAIKAGRVYGTTHARILAAFSINNVFMGGTVSVSGCVNIHINVKGTSEISEVRIVKDGSDFKVLNPGDKYTDILLQDMDISCGNHYYYVVITQDNGEMAWISPIFVENTI